MCRARFFLVEDILDNFSVRMFVWPFHLKK